MNDTAYPATGVKLLSTVTAQGELRLALAQLPVTAPGAGEVLVKMVAAPIHPADMMVLLAGANPTEAKVISQAGGAEILAPLSARLRAASALRAGRPLEVGLEGAGTVVAAGQEAEQLAGRRVAVLVPGLGSYGAYCKVPVASCLPLPDDIDTKRGASAFTNPLTALAMIETLYQTGERAMVHTAAASTLGQMLVRICIEDGIALVNVVRRQEQAELLRAIGAKHVCVSSDRDYRAHLDAALTETGARVAFDAIGGGDTASGLIVAMERAAAARMAGYNAYGSSEMKRVYVYGRLDPSDTTLPKGAYGMRWSVEGWAMPPILDVAGDARKAELLRRIAGGLDNTFASTFGREITLAQMLDPEIIQGFSRARTGGKYLVLLEQES